MQKRSRKINPKKQIFLIKSILHYDADENTGIAYFFFCQNQNSQDNKIIPILSKICFSFASLNEGE